MIGYGQVRSRPPLSSERHACDCCNSCCCVPFEACCSGSCPGDWLTAEQSSSTLRFNQSSFLRKRVARLAPMYYISNFLCLVMMLIALPPDGQNDDPPMDNITLTIFIFVLSSLGVTSWISIQPSNFTAWAISTMAFFYMCFPSLMPRLQRLNSSTSARAFAMRMYCTQFCLCLATMLFGALVYTHQQGPGLQIGYWFTRSFPPWRLPVFIMGCCCARQVMQHSEQEQSGCSQPNTNVKFLGSKVVASCGCLHPSTGLLVWFLATCALCSVIARTAFAALDSEAAIAINFAIRMILEICLPILFYDWVLSLTESDAKSKSVVARILATPPFAFLADISMTVYLIHFVVVILVSYTANDGAYLGMPWWGICVAFPVSILLGWSMTRFVEKPLQRCIRGDGGQGILVRSNLIGKASCGVGEPVQVISTSSYVVGSSNETTQVLGQSSCDGGAPVQVLAAKVSHSQ